MDDEADITAILSRPDYFTCERMHTRMLKARCVERQEKAFKVHDGHGGVVLKQEFEQCKKCGQGDEIKKKSERRAEKMKKVCRLCRIEKDLEDEFPKNHAAKGGYENTCKACKSEQAKARRLAKKKGEKPSEEKTARRLKVEVDFDKVFPATRVDIVILAQAIRINEVVQRQITAKATLPSEMIAAVYEDLIHTWGVQA